MQSLKTWAAAAAILAMTGAAQAALVSLGDGTVKDTNTNLVWLQDWNVNGLQNWTTQRDWALGLDFAGSTDWRLPGIGEYQALFTAYGDLSAVTDFTNVQRLGRYWSGTEFTPGAAAYHFYPGFGGSVFVPEDELYFAVAVRPGDVTASVPEPQTLALALLALGATVVARRRRSA